MEKERIDTDKLLIDELFESFIESINDRKDGFERSTRELDKRMRGFAASQLNTMKKYVLNNYDIRPVAHYYQTSKFRFLCYILGYLKDTVSYTRNYEDMIKYLEQYPYRGPYGDPKFNKMLDRLSIPELYQALIGGDYGTNDSILRRIMDKIKEEEKKEEKKKEEEKEEKYGELKDRLSYILNCSPIEKKELKDKLSHILNCSPEEVIMIMFECLMQQNKILEEIKGDIDKLNRIIEK